MRPLLGIVLFMAGIAMWVIAFSAQNAGLLLLSLPFGALGGVAIGPWFRERAYRREQKREDLEHIIAIQRSRRRKELKEAMYGDDE